MVKTQEEYVWQFIPAGLPGEMTKLSWNKDAHNSLGKQLFLLDEEQLKIVNMMEIDQYQFTLTDKSSFRIFYGTDIQNKVTAMNSMGNTTLPKLIAGDANVTINLALPDNAGDYSVDFSGI